MSLHSSQPQGVSDRFTPPDLKQSLARSNRRSLRWQLEMPAALLRHTVCSVAVGIFFLAGNLQPSVRALEPAAVRQEPIGVPPKEVAAIVADLDDIAGMRPLLPLKLTVEQLDNMVTILVAARVIYDRDIGQMPGPIVSKMADEIRAVKKAALRGEPIPKDFDDKIKKADRELLTKRDKINGKNLGNVCDRLQKILSPEQITAAVDFDLAKHGVKKDAPLQDTKDQWFASYVVDALLNNPRIVPVLRLMREAKVPYAKSNSAEKSGKDVPGQAGK